MSRGPASWHEPASEPLKLGLRNCWNAWELTRAVLPSVVWSEVLRSLVRRQSMHTLPSNLRK
jgi:hypothetical protein